MATRTALAEVDTMDAPAGDFDSYLETSMDDIQEPEICPSGPWNLRLTSTFVQKNSAEDRESNPKLPLGSYTFYYTPVEPLEGVNPEKVEHGKWRGRRIRHSFNINDPSDMTKVKKHLETLGVDTSGRSVKEGLEVARGHIVKATVSRSRYFSKKQGEEVEQERLSNFAIAE